MVFSFQIRWENRLKRDNGSICKVTVDGTDFRINLPGGGGGNFKKYFSHKFKGPALRYEVAISIATGEIVHIKGPFRPGVMNDLKIFRVGLKKKLKFLKERAEADDGYRGEYFFIDLPKDGCFHSCPERVPCQGCIQHGLKQRLRTRHETCNRRFKSWKILGERYRHELKFHGFVFSAVAVVTQIEIRCGNKLFYCPQYKTQESDQRRNNTRELLRLAS